MVRGKCAALIRLSMAMAMAIAIGSGCAEPVEPGAAQLAVHAGTPSTLDAVGMVACTVGDGEYTGGIFLTNRHFLRVGVDCAAENTRVFAGPLVEGGVGSLTVVRNHETSTAAGQALVIAVLEGEGDVMSVERSTAPPAIDDDLTVVGFGAAAYDPSDTFERTEGAFRVSDVAGDATTFTVAPVGDVRSCVGDSTVLDGSGALLGLMTNGALDPDFDDCFATNTALSLVPHAAWIDEVLAMPVPDPPMEDAGLPDAMPEDTSVADTSVDGGSTTPPASSDGCGCRVTDVDARGGLAGALITLIALAWRRRR